MLTTSSGILINLQKKYDMIYKFHLFTLLSHIFILLMNNYRSIVRLYRDVIVITKFAITKFAIRRASKAQSIVMY